MADTKESEAPGSPRQVQITQEVRRPWQSKGKGRGRGQGRGPKGDKGTNDQESKNVIDLTQTLT